MFFSAGPHYIKTPLREVKVEVCLTPAGLTCILMQESTGSVIKGWASCSQ